MKIQQPFSGELELLTHSETLKNPVVFGCNPECDPATQCFPTMGTGCFPYNPGKHDQLQKLKTPKYPKPSNP